MIRAIIFDCFGVLAEDAWLPFKRKYIGEDTELADQVVDLGKQNEYGMINNDEYYASLVKLTGADEALLRSVLGHKVPNEELFDYIAKELKPKYKIGLMSNANYDVTKELFTPEQASLFDASVLSFECRMIKPDPRMYQLIADRLGVLPEECVFVDDVERYCIAAEDVGMQSILFKETSILKKQLFR